VELVVTCNTRPFEDFVNIRYVFYLGRAMQGLACAGFIPAGIGILASLYQPGRRKNRVFSAFSASQPLGGAIGGV
jgi:MFS family permease